MNARMPPSASANAPASWTAAAPCRFSPRADDLLSERDGHTTPHPIAPEDWRSPKAGATGNAPCSLTFRGFLLLLLLAPSITLASPTNEHVILLHGLCRTSHSMQKMESALTAAGYQVWNIDYPSRTNTVTALSEAVLAPAIRDCESAGATRIHFVGHSLGAILIRDYLARHALPTAGHVVMLGPPNQGSEIVDKLGSWWLFKRINGPAGCELGTKSDSAPNQIGPANVRVGVIAGNRSINWINSLMIPGNDDGKVSVRRTKLEGMTDHIMLRTAHPFLMKNATAIKQTVHFLRTGKFDHSSKSGVDAFTSPNKTG